MKRKFFFFDIDGTLAVGTPGNQYVPESTKIAISKLKGLVILLLLLLEGVMRWQ